MTLPSISVQISFQSPTESPTWTDVTSYVEGFTVRRGRQRRLDRIEAGTATVRFYDPDRRFDPTNASGPYYPFLRPMRRVRIRATWAGFTFPVFTGYADGWPTEERGYDRAVAEVSATDGFKPLSLALLNATYPAQTPYARINAVLDDILWTTGTSWLVGDATLSVLGSTTTVGPTGDRAIAWGQTTQVQGVTLVDVPALDHLQDVAETEAGMLFMSADGAVVFRSRHHTLLPPNNTSRATFGDDLAAGELPYKRLVRTYDDGRLWNEVRVTRAGGTVQTASDAISRALYFPRTLTKTGTLHASDAEALSMANWLLGLHKDAELWITALTLEPRASPFQLWTPALWFELGDKITVRRRPEQGGAMIEQPSHIEGVRHDFDAERGTWTTEWSLSPSETRAGWVVGDAASSVLGSTTRVAY